MKKKIQKATTWLMLVCMTIGMIPAFGCAAAAEAKPASSIVCADKINTAAVLADDPGATADPDASQSEGWNANNVFDLLTELFKAIGLNLRSVSVNDLLNLPANMMDDVVTYIFGALKMLGFNVDSMYEKFLSFFSAFI